MSVKLPDLPADAVPANSFFNISFTNCDNDLCRKCGDYFCRRIPFKQKGVFAYNTFSVVFKEFCNNCLITKPFRFTESIFFFRHANQLINAMGIKYQPLYLGSSETVSFFLPFALRAARTFLPPTEAILSLKPCLFFLFLFDGWYVLFIKKCLRNLSVQI